MGVWAIGKTLEECRRELKEVVEAVDRNKARSAGAYTTVRWS